MPGQYAAQLQAQSGGTPGAGAGFGGPVGAGTAAAAPQGAQGGGEADPLLASMAAAALVFSCFLGWHMDDFVVKSTGFCDMTT